MTASLYLMKSRIRRDALALFFANPERRYYLRELSRILDCSAGSLRRELQRFESDGLLGTEKTGNLLYYSLNKEHPLFNEIKGIIYKTVGIEGRLRQALGGVPGVQTAFIYGSFASGTENSASDIDVFIIGSASLKDLSGVARMIQRELQREINVTLYPKAEYVAKRRAGRGFFKDVLDKPKIMLIGNECDL